MKLTKSEKYHNVYSYRVKKGTLYAFRCNYYDFTGKRHEKQQRGFKTELAAYKASLKVELQAAEEDTSQLVDSQTTVTQWANRFVEMRKARWRPSYLLNVNNCIKHYINPLIGKKQLGRLNKMQYDYLFIQPQIDRKLSPSTIKAHHRIVMAIFNSAVESEIIPNNKLRGIKLPAGPKRKAFSESDLQLFNSQLEVVSLNQRALFYTLELTGMRKGEALALTWNDINFKESEVTINKSRSAFGVGPTKTEAGNRTIALPAKLTRLLKQYRLHQQRDALGSGRSFTSDGLIFMTRLNRPFNALSTDRDFKNIVKDAGIEADKYVVHSLRHTHATLLIEAGVSPVEVAHRLGHANAAITLSVYAHATGNHDTENAEKFSEIVNF